MIEITPPAAERLAALRASDPAKGVLRLYVAGRGCCRYRYGLAFDERAETDDTVQESRGIPIAVDPRSLPVVADATIDFVDALMGGGFVVRTSADAGGCACGRR